MADEGTLRNFLDKHLNFNGADNNVLTPDSNANPPNNVDPEKMMVNRSAVGDPRIITNDQGQQVDYDVGDAWKKFISKPAEQGTLRNFMQRMISPERERNNAGFEGGAQPRTDELLGIPNKNVSPATLAPTVPEQPKNYAMKGLDAPSIQELRASLYKQSGQGAPPLATANQDPNALEGRMNSPYAQAEMQDQKKQAMDISAMFRPKTAGSIERPGQVKAQTPSLREWLMKNGGNL